MKKYLAILSILAFCAACSVNKASDLQGATAEDITKCQRKECFLGLGSQVLESKTHTDGSTSTVYKVKRKNGNVGRAVLYGLADVATLGLWEIIGTPLEGYVSDKESIVYEVKYSSTGEVNKVTIQGQ